MESVILILVAGLILLCVVVAFYALWEALFHSRNVQLILAGEEPRKHRGHARTICKRVTGEK